MKAKKMFARVLRELAVEIRANAVGIGESNEICMLKVENRDLEDALANAHQRVLELELKLGEKKQQLSRGTIEISPQGLYGCICNLWSLLRTEEINKEAVAQVLVVIFGENKIMAIKTYRAIFNVSLGEAKDAIESK